MFQMRSFDIELKKKKRKYHEVKNREWVMHEEFKRDNILLTKLISNQDNNFYLYLGKFKNGDYFFSHHQTTFGIQFDKNWRDLNIRYRIFKNSMDCLYVLVRYHTLSDSEMEWLHEVLKDILTEEDLVAYHLTMTN